MGIERKSRHAGAKRRKTQLSIVEQRLQGLLGDAALGRNNKCEIGQKRQKTVPNRNNSVEEDSRMSDEIVGEFLVESTENLDLLDRELITLEKDPGNSETMSSIFRTIHTIKGTCGFLGFTKLESVAHAGENLLSQLRDGEMPFNPERTTALLSLVDAIRQMLDSIRANGAEGERDDRALIATLERLQVKKKKPAHETAGKKEASVALPIPAEEQAAKVEVSAPEKSVSKTQEVAAPAPASAEQAGKGAIADASIRVDVVLLDKLMNLVGELVLARNQILQHSNAGENAGLSTASQRLNLITTELQEGVMKTRMQPIGNIWGKFPRTVRDVAVSCGKEVRIEMEGKETELDKTIIEAIKDPLTHLVRNAVDHGIERPAERVAAGKPAEGLLRLRAYHEGGPGQSQSAGKRPHWRKPGASRVNLRSGAGRHASHSQRHRKGVKPSHSA